MSNLNGEVEVHKQMETTIGEMSSGTNVTDNTALKKRKRRKMKNSSPDLGGVVSTRENTQEGLNMIKVLGVKCNKAVSSKTTTSDANMLSKEHDYTTEVANGKTETTDLNVNGMEEREKKLNSKKKGPTLAEILNPHYSTSLEAAKGEPVSGTTLTNNQESRKQKRQNINRNSDLGDVVNTHESTREGSSTIKVPDENMMSKEQDHTEVANGKMEESETTDLNVKGKNKKKKEPKTSGEILNPNYLQNLDASRGEKGSGSTSTDNPVSKKHKIKLNKNAYSSDVLSTTHESTQEVLSTATTATDNTAVKKRKREKNKNDNSDLCDFSSTRENTQEGLSTTKVLELKNDEMVSVKIATPDANMVLKEQDHTEVANGKKKRKRKPESKNTLPTLEEKHMEYTIGDMGLSARTNLDVTDVRNEETKKLLILDVNGLLVDVSLDRPKDVIADKYMHGRAIFKRPYLDDFLHFCFQRFNVAIWSSRTMRKLDPLVHFLFRDLKWKLLFVWDACECTDSFIDTLEVKNKHVVVKDLRKIWEADGPNNKWVKGDFNGSNTLLVDDSPYKGLLNPKYTGIFPDSYSYKNNSDDNFLGPKGELQTYLEGLAAADDVRTYVEQHPFGQGVIDEQNPNWEFYSSVLEQLNNERVMKSLLKKNRWKRKKCCHGYQKPKRHRRR